MKTKSIFCLFLVAICFLCAFVQPAESAKILVIVKDDPAGESADTETIESLMTRQLLKAGYEVVTPDSLASSPLMAEDIFEAKTGNIPKARNLAESCQASLILMTWVAAHISSQEVYGVKLNKAVAVNTYKLIDAATGRLINTDSVKYRAAASSPEEAKHKSFVAMADGFTQVIAQKAPRGSRPELSTMAAPSARERISSEPVLTSAPRIVITKPFMDRGLSRGLSRAIRKRIGKKDVFTIEGEVTDNSGIQSVTINDDRVRVDSSGRFSHDVSLSPGENRFHLVAKSMSGNTGTKDIIITKERPGLPTGVKPVLWGLSIGVSQYANPGLNLRYADKDALSLARVLEQQEKKLFSEVHLKTLVNADVTRDTIIDSISTHLGKAAPDDVIFIFIAGHGIKHQRSGSYYFVPHNADANSILTKGLRMSDFNEAVKILSKDVNKVIIAMDTCHSGAMKVGARNLGEGHNLAEALKEATGLFILAASKAGESSLEDSRFRRDDTDSGHGAFTYALLEGISGKANSDQDEYISLNELFHYVAKQVPRMTEGRQHPYFTSEGTHMPFILLKE